MAVPQAEPQRISYRWCELLWTGFWCFCFMTSVADAVFRVQRSDTTPLSEAGLLPHLAIAARIHTNTSREKKIKSEKLLSRWKALL